MKDSTRNVLYKELPLEMPYLVQIFPCYACNFKCQYCLHSLPRSQHSSISKRAMLDISVFKSLIDNIAVIGKKIKMLRFAGIGEPLLHPDIAEMVSYAQKKRIAHSVDIVTNGALLTPSLSEQLISAGLTTLRVSVEGLSSAEYKQHTGVDISFDDIVSNIRYYYEHSKKSRVYVKIIDYMLNDSSTKEQIFYQIFKPISHLTSIEHLTPTIKEINYNEFSGSVDFSLTQDGMIKQDIRICPQPFYMIQLNPDGSFVPCCSMRYPIVLQKSSKLADVWNSEEFNKFRATFLHNAKVPICRECTLYKYGAYPEDILDGHEDELLEKFIFSGNSR